MENKFWIILYQKKVTVRLVGTLQDLNELKSKFVLSLIQECPLVNSVYYNVLAMR